MQAGQCGSQMGTKFQKVLCDEHVIGGDGEYCGDNDAQLDRIKVFYHDASGDKYVPRTVLFDLEPGVIDAVRAAAPLALPSGKSRETLARAKLGLRPLQKD
jgi:tubulin beta